jgi:hypothetical protein
VASALFFISIRCAVIMRAAIFQTIHEYRFKGNKNMALRLSVQDAMRDIRAWLPQNSKNFYSAVLNSDGSIKVTQNNTTVLNQKFWWNLTGNQASAKTDANGGSNDTIVIEDSDGSNPRVSDFTQWLNSLP